MESMYPTTIRQMGFNATKPVFRVSDKVRFKPACSATEKIEISFIASLEMILSKKRITKALIRLRGCVGWSAHVLFANPRRQVFSRRGQNYAVFSIDTITQQTFDVILALNRRQILTLDLRCIWLYLQTVLSKNLTL